MSRANVIALVLILSSTLLAGCAAAGGSRMIELEMQNDSGVTGAVTLTEVGAGRTRVDVRVDPADNRDMPAHVHPGSCADLVPQPKYPLQNVVDGVSATVVPASMAELLAGDLAVNLHRSNEDLRTYTACADLH